MLRTLQSRQIANGLEERWKTRWWPRPIDRQDAKRRELPTRERRPQKAGGRDVPKSRQRTIKKWEQSKNDFGIESRWKQSNRPATLRRGLRRTQRKLNADGINKESRETERRSIRCDIAEALGKIAEDMKNIQEKCLRW